MRYAPYTRCSERGNSLDQAATPLNARNRAGYYPSSSAHQGRPDEPLTQPPAPFPGAAGNVQSPATATAATALPFSGVYRERTAVKKMKRPLAKKLRRKGTNKRGLPKIQPRG
jgi:hypothetical protein